MSKRNLWTFEETKTMLSIMQEQNSIRLFDGKLYRNVEIYKKIETELVKRGYSTKDYKQIETRWKNLKRQYINAKKNNKRSGNDRQLCAFYEELDEMLGCRPAVNISSFGIDTSRNDENSVEIDVPEGEFDNSSSIPSTSAAAANGSQRKESRGRGSYAKCIEKLGATIKETQHELNKEFFENQKKLIDYEFNLYTNKEEEFERNFNEKTKEILEENTRQFLAGISDILKNDNNNKNNGNSLNKSANIKDYINSFSLDD